MNTKSYNFMTIRLWAKEKNDGSEKLEMSIEPEMLPGFGEPGSALERYAKALTGGMKAAAVVRSDEDKILNRAEIRALIHRIEKLQKSGQNPPGKSLIREQKEGI
jgi:hypothetical protein